MVIVAPSAVLRSGAESGEFRRGILHHVTLCTLFVPTAAVSTVESSSIEPLPRIFVLYIVRKGKRNHALLQRVQWTFNETVILSEVMQHLVEQLLLVQDFRVTYDNQTTTCARNRNVQAARVAQETNTSFLIRTNARQNNEILFSTLE